MKVELEADWRDFVAAELASGAYSSEADVVRAALALLEAESRNRDQLDALLAEGELSANFQQWDFQAFLREVHADDARREAA